MELQSEDEDTDIIYVESQTATILKVDKIDKEI